MDEVPKKYSVSTIIITTLAVIIILALAFLFFYYSTRPVPTMPESAPYVRNNNPPVVAKPAPQIIPTNVITFSPSQPLPTSQKTGKCLAGSIAAPYRQDAFRCMVGNSIYDPCFTVPQKGFVYCQINVDSSTGFLIKLTQTLPKPTVLSATQDNWGWFVKLKDGTFCSPFTGTRPFFGTGPAAEVAYYGCDSKDKTQQIYLLGDLTEGSPWTAKMAIVVKNEIKSTQQVDIETVWQ